MSKNKRRQKKNKRQIEIILRLINLIIWPIKLLDPQTPNVKPSSQCATATRLQPITGWRSVALRLQSKHCLFMGICTNFKVKKLSINSQ